MDHLEPEVFAIIGDHSYSCTITGIVSVTLAVRCSTPSLFFPRLAALLVLRHV